MVVGIYIDKKLVIIAGFRKCGTTTLYDYLIENAGIKKGRLKEPQLLNSGGAITKSLMLKYTDLFESNTEIFIDGSTLLIGQPEVIAELKGMFKEVVVLICVRNPIKRFLSAYWHNKGKAKSYEKRELNELLIELKNYENPYFQELENLKKHDFVREDLSIDYLRRENNIDHDFTARNYYQPYQYYGEGLYSHFLSELDKLEVGYEVLIFEEFANFSTKTHRILERHFLLKSKLPIFSVDNENKTYNRSGFLFLEMSFVKVLKSLFPLSIKRKLRGLLFKAIDKPNNEQLKILEELYENEIDFWRNYDERIDSLWR